MSSSFCFLEIASPSGNKSQLNWSNISPESSQKLSSQKFYANKISAQVVKKASPNTNTRLSQPKEVSESNYGYNTKKGILGKNFLFLKPGERPMFRIGTSHKK